jgi:predicted phage terminase large subunit-like protein
MRVPYLSPHFPHPRQAVFLSLDEVIEALYGGAAGGGKSDAILMGSLQDVDKPRYSALILRRTFADLSLPDAIMARAKEWLYGKPGVKWNEGMKSFSFFEVAGKKIDPPSRLTFGFLEGENDKYRYQGSAYQYIGFDELTQFRESDYRYLFSRLRRTEEQGADVPLRMRGATNPGGVGHEWVKARFISKQRPDRLFVAARLADNPSLDQEAYEGALAQLDDISRAQLLYGDWDVRPDGKVFRQGTFHYLEPEEFDPAGYIWVRRWDLAATKPVKGKDPDYTVGVLMGRHRETGRCVVADVVRLRNTPDEVERVVKATAERDGRELRVRMEQEPGASGVHLIDHYGRKVLWGYNFSGDKVTGDKVARAMPYATMANRGQVDLIRADWNSAYVGECEAFPDGAHDDQVDASSGAHHDLVSNYEPGAGTIEPPDGRRIDDAYRSRRHSYGSVTR